LVVKVRNLKQAMTICSPAPGQYAALAGLQGDAA
jgi:aspartate/methionine/tyrosine aminotransferase